MEILLASSNSGKIAEVTSLLAETPISLRSINSDPTIRELEVEESGTTFKENALLKARAYAATYALPVISDDSGLEVMALEGKPGVQSNRWFPGTDADRNHELLRLLTHENNRAAQFVTVACFLPSADATPHFFRGVIRGTITTEPMGTAGFGYDPIFIPEGYTQTFAQLGTEVKNALSHRALAFKKAVAFIKATYTLN